MTVLPDALLLRDYWGDNGPRSRVYNGVRYHAVSVWGDEAAAKDAATAIRAQGNLARVTQEKRPLRAYSGKTPEHILRMRRGPGRYMWLVFAAAPHSTEINAHAGEKGATSG